MDLRGVEPITTVPDVAPVFGEWAGTNIFQMLIYSDEASGEDEAATGDLHLAEVGDKKVDVIKAVRSITGLGLKDAKALVDGAPSPIKEGISKAEADEFTKQLEEAGAKAEFK